MLRLAAVDPPPLAAALVNASAFVLTGYVGDVASLSVSGGVGAYTYSVGDDFAVDTDGLLRLALAQSNVATLTATVVIDDSHDNTAPITAGYTLLVVEQLRFTSAPPVTIITSIRGSYTRPRPWAASATLVIFGHPPIRRLCPPTLTSVPTTARFVFNKH